MGLESIRDPGKSPFRIPDPGVKMAPDQGSWIRNTAYYVILLWPKEKYSCIIYEFFFVREFSGLFHNFVKECTVLLRKEAIFRN
jgi:hypothetical protein